MPEKSSSPEGRGFLSALGLDIGAADIGVAAILIAAVAMVYVVDSFRTNGLSDFVDTRDNSRAPDLSLAVTTPEFDDMGRLLDMLGQGYMSETIELDQLIRKEALQKYDVVFLTCGGLPGTWLGGAISEGPRDTTVHEIKRDVARRLKDELRAFVQKGGTLYASDWRYSLVQLAFPELVPRSEVEVGIAQQLDARVVDDGLREIIGESIHLRFDLGSWYPAAFVGRDVRTYLEGRYETVNGGFRSLPLLAKVPFGEGTIVFTSFHNEKQNSDTEIELLKYLVFATVTARLDSEVAENMLKGGFSPQKQNLLSTSSQEASVTKTYRCQKKGNLQFVLAFENRGATLRLNVVGPNGQKYDKEGTSTLRVDIQDADVGDWQYTVTAERVPYQNFPFTLTVWQK